MLWKEEYKIGVTNIDNQHKLLFDRLDLLLFELAKNDKEHSRAECLKAIEYIKILSVKHFADEEMFQRSIQYSGIHTHIKEHEIFTNTLLDYEKDFHSLYYRVDISKDFFAFLLSWSINHIRGSDKNILLGKQPELLPSSTKLEELFFLVLEGVFESIFFTKINVIETLIYKPITTENTFSIMKFEGNCNFIAMLSFPYEMIIHMICFVLNSEITDLDATVLSTLERLSSMISNKVAVLHTNHKDLCHSLKPIVTLSRYDHNQYSFTNGLLYKIKTDFGFFELIIKELEMEVDSDSELESKLESKLES